ncbi:DMT family transporter [Candidatus Thioglobus sp.]|nr:DMT family transporter [Candidatus Thioglobus sp.]MDB9951008.1 DMT family transporter [Candidatus Thioglobus sp.]
MIKKLLNDLWIIRFFKSQSFQTKAIILNILSIVFFSIMVIFIRKASENLHILEVVFFRNLLAFIVMLPLLTSTGLAAIKMNNTKLFFMRGFFGAIGMLAGFTCLTLIPLAQATAISFSKPIFITIGATIFLGEIIKARRIAAIIIGIIGMLIIVQPGVNSLSFGIMLAIIAALAHSINALIVKKLTLTDSPQAIVMWMVIILIPITFVPAVTVWQWPSFETWLYLWGIAIVGTLAHFSWTKSYTMAEITSLESIEFIKLPIMALFGWMIFSEIPGTWTWIGGSIIFISTIYISRREAKAANSLKLNHDAQEPKF